MRDDDIIEAEIAVVPPKALGYGVMVIALVTLDREGTAIIDKFKKAIRETPEIINGYYITGDVDFALMIVAQSPDEYEKFTREFFYERHRVRSFKTLVVLDRVKAHGPIPIPD